MLTPIWGNYDPFFNLGESCQKNIIDYKFIWLSPPHNGGTSFANKSSRSICRHALLMASRQSYGFTVRSQIQVAWFRVNAESAHSGYSYATCNGNGKMTDQLTTLRPRTGTDAGVGPGTGSGLTVIAPFNSSRNDDSSDTAIQRDSASAIFTMTPDPPPLMASRYSGHDYKATNLPFQRKKVVVYRQDAGRM